MTTLKTNVSMAEVQASGKPLRQLAVEYRTAYWSELLDRGFNMNERIEQKWDDTRYMVFYQDDKYNRLEQRKIDRAREKTNEVQRELQDLYPYIFAF